MALSTPSAFLRIVPILLLWSALDDNPLSENRKAELKRQLDKTITESTAEISRDPANVQSYSRRADAYLFHGDFSKAVADYDTMLELKPDLRATLWQRGLACFYAGQFKQAADQFAAYHAYDNRDRENGIWHYFSNAKAHGIPKARQELLKYDRFDREPFPSLYRLVEGTMTPTDVLSEIDSAKVDSTERQKRLFYAELYIGLNHAVEDKPDLAKKHLRKATRSTWAPGAGYGAAFMWHIGRLQYDLLMQASPN